ncbi:MAG TPA: ABC transporter substrate-binding protein [Polyangia bacterium]|nr:ABC transporter substrate-binding protein [Polyangia bacterium]
MVVGVLLGDGAPAFASVSSAVDLSRPSSSECRAISPSGVDPLAELRQSDSALSAALRRHVPDWSPEAPVHAARLRRLLSDILDYEAIARLALGARWDALTAEQRSSFLSLFSPLTDRALLSAAEKHVAVTYESETVVGPEATVVVTPRSIEGAGAVSRIEYKLGQHCGRWRIHDVVVDGVSLVDSYRAQFDRLFKSGSFEDLLAIMRRRLHHEARP